MATMLLDNTEKVEFARHVTGMYYHKNKPPPVHWERLKGGAWKLTSECDGPLYHLKAANIPIPGVFFSLNQTYRREPMWYSAYPLDEDAGKDYWCAHIPLEHVTSSKLNGLKLEDREVLLFRISAKDCPSQLTLAAILEGSEEHKAIEARDDRGYKKYDFEQLKKGANKYFWFRNGEWRVNLIGLDWKRKDPCVQLFIPGDVIIPKDHVQWKQCHKMKWSFSDERYILA